MQTDPDRDALALLYTALSDDDSSFVEIVKPYADAFNEGAIVGFSCEIVHLLAALAVTGQELAGEDFEERLERMALAYAAYAPTPEK